MKQSGVAMRFEQRSDSSPEKAMAVAMELLADIMQFRRIPGAYAECETKPCYACLAPHLAQVTYAVQRGLPITFVLPAFPGKSPNPAKVLGPLPDMAERRALEFLGHLCDRVRRYHAPGARLILCSDGRVFSDAVGMREEDVTAYQQELSGMIEEMSLTSIRTFNLDDFYKGLDFSEMRRQLMENYGQPLEELKEKVRRGAKPGSDPKGEETHRLYCGITRFLVEDSIHPAQTLTRSAIQKDCRIRAYEVIQRSNAWSELIREVFPEAVRLSIHPQTCGSVKLGIRLMEAESWMTPWHGVAVDLGGRIALLKRSEAEALGARLIFERGRPSHYEIKSESGLATMNAGLR